MEAQTSPLGELTAEPALLAATSQDTAESCFRASCHAIQLFGSRFLVEPRLL